MEKYLSKLFAALAVGFAAATLYLCFASLSAPARLLLPPKEADIRTEQLLEAVSRGDLAVVESMLLNQPELEQTQALPSACAERLWKAYYESIAYAFDESCQPTASGLSRQVTVEVMDLSGVMSALSSRYDGLLEEKRKGEEDLSFLQNENDPRREAFLQSVLEEALTQVLAENKDMVSRDLTLNLTLRKGQWWILPDSAWMDLLTGNWQQIADPAV